MTQRELELYLRIAKAVSRSGTCGRLQVGSVIAKDKVVLGIGFNGSAKGDDHCDTHGHIMDNGHCLRAIHSEENAIINAARSGTSTIGSIMVCTHKPCYRCLQRIINAGIIKCYYNEDYGIDMNRHELMVKTRFPLIQISGVKFNQPAPIPQHIISYDI